MCVLFVYSTSLQRNLTLSSILFGKDISQVCLQFRSHFKLRFFVYSNISSCVCRSIHLNLKILIYFNTYLNDQTFNSKKFLKWIDKPRKIWFTFCFWFYINFIIIYFGQKVQEHKRNRTEFDESSHLLAQSDLLSPLGRLRESPRPHHQDESIFERISTKESKNRYTAAYTTNFWIKIFYFTTFFFLIQRLCRLQRKIAKNYRNNSSKTRN